MNRLIASVLCATAGLAFMPAAHADQTTAVQLCMTQKHLETGLANARTIQQAAKTDKSLTTVARVGFSYLPEGHPQQGAGYDTCPLTGSGYTYDHTVVQPTRYDHECDSAGPRPFRINCQSGTASFDVAQNTGGEGGQQAQQGGQTVDFIPGQTQVCKRGIGREDPETESKVFMSPSCQRPLSSFQLEGYYPACQNTSRTYRTCHAVLSGTLQNSQPGSARERSDENYIRNGFCALPQGQKIIDHVTAFNALKDRQFVADSTNLVNEISKSLQVLNAQIREQKIDCRKVQTF